MNVGDVVVVHTTLARPPKDKITVCVCTAPNQFLWINTNPARHGVGQFELAGDDHAALDRPCFLDCSRLTTFSEEEMATARNRGPITPNLAKRILEFIKENPPSTLRGFQVDIVVDAMAYLCQSE